MAVFEKCLYSLATIFAFSYLSLHLSSFPLSSKASIVCTGWIIMKKQHFSISKLVSTASSHTKTDIMQYSNTIFVYNKEKHWTFIESYTQYLFDASENELKDRRASRPKVTTEEESELTFFSNEAIFRLGVLETISSTGKYFWWT